jgi:hypothetical protein
MTNPKREAWWLEVARTSDPKVKTWWLEVAALHKRKSREQLLRQIRLDRQILFGLCRVAAEDNFAKGMEGVEAVERLVKNCYAYKTFEGMRRGFELGLAVAARKAKLSETQRTIVGLLVRAPGLTTLQICRRLDKHSSVAMPTRWENQLLRNPHRVPGQRLHWETALGNTALQDAVQKYFSDLRKKAREFRHFRVWHKLVAAGDNRRKKKRR